MVLPLYAYIYLIAYLGENAPYSHDIKYNTFSMAIRVCSEYSIIIRN